MGRAGVKTFHTVATLQCGVGLLLIAIGCSLEQPKVHKSKAAFTHQLLASDTLTFFSRESVYVSRVGDITAWQGWIVISDFYAKTVRLFDSSFHHKGSLGRPGAGPGEFTNFPLLVPAGESLWLFDDGLMRASMFGKDLKLRTIKPLPGEYYFRRQAVWLGDKFVVSLNPPRMLERASSLRGEAPLAILDTNLQVVRRFWTWDDVYASDDLAWSTYAFENIDVLLAPAWDGGLFALQKASYLVTHFDRFLRKQQKFGTTPTFFKKPPDESVAYSSEKISEYLGKTTTFLRLVSDVEQRRVFVHYVNFESSILFARTLLAGKHYLQIYNSDYDCIFDGEIPGLLAFVKSGRVYVLTHEQPEFLRMEVFTVVPRDSRTR